MKRHLLAFLVVWGLMAPAGFSQTVLSTGDLAIIGYNFDDADQLKVVPLVDLSVNTVINFTDNGWTGSALATNEGTYVWTVTSAITAGTVVTLNTTGMSLATTGDQVFAYQGTSGSPTFIYGISTTVWITSGTITTNNSYRPSVLTNGTYTRDFSTEFDDGNYTIVSNTGSKSDILTAIGNTANWSLTNTRITSWPAWTFTVGNYAPEPTAQPTNLNFTNVKSWSYNVNYTAASPAPAGYLVIRKQGSSPTGSPVDGTPYQKGDNVGDAKVAYVGTGITFLQEGIVASTGYYYKVYSYNGTGAQINYRQTSPLTNNVTSGGNGMGTYYSTINTANSTFVTDLKNRVRSPYTKVTYDNFDETNVTHFSFRDTTLARRVVTCIYSGEKYIFTPPMAWTPITTFSREHTWCHSWMPTFNGTGGNEYADQHHLFPINQNMANGVRSNHPMGEVVTVISSYLEGKYGYDAAGNTVYEPRDSHKGDAARALLYMSLRYDGVASNNWTFNWLNGTKLPALNEDPQDINLLLTWHSQDAPDNYEIARNDYVWSIQQNRNPFVDHPEYADYINWGDLTHNPSGKTDPMPEIVMNDLSLDVFPNPFEDYLIVNTLAPSDLIVTLTVSDINGRILHQQELAANEGGNSWQIQTGAWSSGFYLVRLTAGETTKIFRTVK